MTSTFTFTATSPDPGPQPLLAPSHEIVVVVPQAPGTTAEANDGDTTTTTDTTNLLLQCCFDVRIAVFHHEQKFPLDTEFDEMDKIATHLLLRLLPSRFPIGTVRGYRITPTTTGAATGFAEYKLSRLCVLKQYRQHPRHHFGSLLVEALHEWIRQDVAQSGLSGAIVISHSQIPVQPFYEKFGYSATGNQFEEDGAPHQKMVAHLLAHGTARGTGTGTGKNDGTDTATGTGAPRV